MTRIGGRGDGRVAVGNQWIVAEDPERTFAGVGKHVLYQVNAYIEFGAFGPPSGSPSVALEAYLTSGAIPNRRSVLLSRSP